MKTVIQSLQNTLENNDTNQQLKTKAIYFTKDIVYSMYVVWSPPPHPHNLLKNCDKKTTAASNNKHCNSYNNQTQKNHRRFYNIDTIV